MKHLIPVALLAACATASHAAPVYLETPVTYAPNAGVVDKVKEECKIEDMFVREASPFFSKANGGEATIAADADPKASRVRVQITHVLGVGGGAWSGPKSMSIEASLVENGKVTRTTKLTRSTTGGAFGGFKGTCTILERSAKALGKDVVGWVANPKAAASDAAEAEPKAQ
ncbi:hypothetical protein [Piscinibacter gummiphilus]|uniref:Uncharacterized protein n=1 Tax=Piscinibacter gummiphilus TaxID=946333 RepID=A0A1W6L5F1_9BURK|nr:hypothetical protein [Piscinibacter gummiphilus]ARN19407.1 hypothetical protein A4W93_05475 [Piscinibacter gummiphilus]ATU64074.1 hypothetical protein CPZ87_05560 [Piscinibacter gummiphilus]GLS92961.1 hypothetical protein GCM10007918_02520 [Piscinibacter gummiphilus]